MPELKCVPGRFGHELSIVEGDAANVAACEEATAMVDVVLIFTGNSLG